MFIIKGNNKERIPLYYWFFIFIIEFLGPKTRDIGTRLLTSPLSRSFYPPRCDSHTPLCLLPINQRKKRENWKEITLFYTFFVSLFIVGLKEQSKNLFLCVNRLSCMNSVIRTTYHYDFIPLSLSFLHYQPIMNAPFVYHHIWPLIVNSLLS